MLPKTMKINQDEQDAFDDSTTVIDSGLKIERFLKTNVVSFLTVTKKT